jgi:hypothetical protein
MLMAFILLSSQNVRAKEEAKNPLRDIALELLSGEGVTRRVKIPSNVSSNALDAAIARSIDASRTTLWVGENSRDGVARWSAGFYTVSRGSIEVELRFFNYSSSELSLPKWACLGVTNIPANTVLSFSQRWLPVHTNSTPVAVSLEPPSQSADALVKSAIRYRKAGDGAKASKSLRMALLAEPLNVWSVVERVFLEDDGEGALEALMKNRVKNAEDFETVATSYIQVNAYSEVETLLSQSQQYPVFDKVRKNIENKLRSTQKSKELAK